MGINLGAMIAPLFCGYLGEVYGWHWGFGAAGVGMLAGLLVFWKGITANVLGDKGLQPAKYIEPKPYVVVEGLLGYSTRAMRDNYDVKIYLDPEEELRVSWKVIRDTIKRGYTEEQVFASLEKRKGDSPAFIQPQRTFADMVIQFYRPEGK